MDIISIIIIAVIIKRIIGKANENSNKNKRSNSSSQNMWDQVAGQVKAGQAQARQYASTAANKSSSSAENEYWKKMARENIEKAKKRAVQAIHEVESVLEIEDKPSGTYQMPKQNVRTTPVYEQITLQQAMQQQGTTQRTKQNESYQQSLQHRSQENKSAMQQVHAGRIEARNTSILERAVKNADEDKVDVTLETMEREHNHSERVSAAEHHHPEDIIPENMLGTIEDLMIKGYDGNLCFERDFVGEAMDMISRFTISTDIPDPSVEDIA